MVYLFDEMEKFSDKDYFDMCSLLSEQQLKKAAKYYRMRDKKLCLLSYLLLRLGLKIELGIVEKPQIMQEGLQKPIIRNIRNIDFNISHCDLGVLCAVAEHKIGVDIQDITDYDVGIGGICLTEKEKACVSVNNNPQLLFTKLWTCKESFGKRGGQGITYDMKSQDFMDCVDNVYTKRQNLWMSLFEFQRYCIAVCSEDKANIKNITYNEIRKYADKNN